MAFFLLIESSKFKILFLPTLFTVFVSCNTSSRIANAYRQQSLIDGASTKDDQTNQTGKQTIIYTVYLETAINKPPQIEVAWIDGNSYQASVIEISKKNTFAGISEKSKDSIILKVPEKHYLYRIEFQPTNPIGKRQSGWGNRAVGRIVLIYPWTSGGAASTLTRPIEILKP